MRPLAFALLALPLAACAAAPVVAATPGRDALDAYLAAHPAYTLRDESDFEPLAWMRSGGYMALDQSPYLLEGDFNSDGRDDLAAIVFGAPADSGDWGDSQPYDSHVLIFNGQPDGTARLASGDLGGVLPLSSLLRRDAAGVGVWLGVAETDFSGHFVPAGEGYDVVFPEMGD